MTKDDLTPSPLHLFTPSSLHLVILSLAVVGLALRLAFALLPLSTHLVVLEDDAWMVTAIARNWALGHGITADGVNATTGFQPLYPLTLGALPYLVASNALHAGFTANLVICALLGTLATWPLWSLARRFGGEHAGVIAVALYALNPLMIRATVNAMETALGLLLLLTLWAAFYTVFDQGKEKSWYSSILLLAVLTALAVLARLDAALAFAAITVTMLLHLWYRTKDEGRGTNGKLYPSSFVLRPSSIMIYVTATLLLLAPYFAFNYAVGGSFGPSSGAALAYLHSYDGAFNLTNGVQALDNNTAVYFDWNVRPTFKIIATVSAAGALMWMLGKRLLVALPLLLYVPVPPLYYGYLLQQSRERYFVGLSVVLIILLAWAGAEIIRRRPTRPTMIGAGIAVALLLALNWTQAATRYQEQIADDDQTQPTAYIAALWMHDNLPHGALIGAKNSGIYQYYSGHTILNIDGKLNHEILPTMQRRELLDYLQQRGVMYLVDREETMALHIAFYSAQFGPAPLHRAPTPTERLMIYGKIAANALGANVPLGLDPPQETFAPTRPFTDVAEIVQRFERPNNRNNPVVVYRLK